MKKIVVAALYHFKDIENFKSFKNPLLQFCLQQNIKGTLILANEGINGTIAGTRHAIDSLLKYLKENLQIPDLVHKESFCNKEPFFRMKVKLKKEIVTLGIENIKPHHQTGQYVEPHDWNKLISDPNVIVIDTRNKYEVDIGTFKNAINPNTTNFRDLPDYINANLASEKNKNKKIAMFCTGGIRCEKSTAYLLQQGFKHVYQLKGGILKYLEEIPKESSLWQGECFVFDNRVAVKNNLEPGSYKQCHGCRHPLSDAEKNSDLYLEGIYCPYCYNTCTPQKINRASERQKQVLIAKSRNSNHLGPQQ